MAASPKDARFDVARDPRFKRLSNRKRKVVLDDRFSNLFQLADSPALGPKRSKTEKSVAVKDLKRLYRLEKPDEDEGNLKDDTTKEPAISEEGEGSTGASDDEQVPGFRWDVTSDSSDEEDEGNEGQLELDDNVWNTVESDVPRGDATRRIAVLGCDWDNLTADDLFVLVHSFLEAGQSIRSVSIYMSNFGAKRSALEDKHGPAISLPPEVATEAPDSESGSDGEKEAESDGEDDAKVTAAFRKYQRERAKYYYAIVDCDSVETAIHLSNSLDGVDVACAIDGLDIRFVSDETAASLPSDPVDKATTLRPHGVSKALTEASGANLQSALRHSRATCNWDKAPAQRSRLLCKRFTEDELKELDLKDYLASSDSDEDAAEEEVPCAVGSWPAPYKSQKSRESSTEAASATEASEEIDNVTRYRKLLLGEDATDTSATPLQKSKDGTKTSERAQLSEDGDSEAEFTFVVNEGLNEEDQNKGPLTPWEKYLEKQKQRKKAKRLATAPRANAKEEVSMKEATSRHPIVKFPLVGQESSYRLESDGPSDSESKGKKGRKSKKSYKKKKVGETNATVSLKVLEQDGRFGALVSDASFAVDPTHPSFTNTDFTRDLLLRKAAKKQRKRERSS